MSTFTVQRSDLPADRFTIVTNDFQRGKLPVPLHAVARCLLGYLLSLPSNWDIDRAQLDRSMVEGEGAVDTGLRELETHGYLRRDKQRAPDGTYRWTWAVTDDPTERPLPGQPALENRGLDLTSTNTIKPQVTPHPGIPPLDNRGISEEGNQKTDKNQQTRARARECDPSPIDTPRNTGSVLELFPTPTPQEPTAHHRDRDPDFTAFWEAYPRKVAKGAAEKTWRSALKHAQPNVIIKGARRYARTVTGKDPQYVKHPGTWLNARCWDDEPDHRPPHDSPMDPCMWSPVDDSPMDPCMRGGW